MQKPHNPAIKPIDRRIQKTKKLLSEALISLILEKGYDIVTVQDIIDKANVGRSTFYAHFESKEQLFLSGHENFDKLLTSDNNRHPEIEDPDYIHVDFLSIYKHTSENLPLAKAILGNKSGDIVFHRLQDVVYHKILKHFSHIKHLSKVDNFRLHAAANAAANAAACLVSGWIMTCL